jgi:hypothetical protein
LKERTKELLSILERSGSNRSAPNEQSLFASFSPEKEALFYRPFLEDHCIFKQG